jgi:hypothetical protein
MGWRLQGTYFENCNCDVLCPCGASLFALPADNERCHVTLVFHVDDGEIDGLDVSGLGYALVADTPGMMAEGNWRVGLIMDAAASAEQAEALAAVASGARGGAPAGFAPLVGENLGMETAPFEYTNDGKRHAVLIGDLADIEVLDFIPDGQTEPITLTNVPHPVNTSLAVAQATRGRVTAFGLEIDNAGKNGHSAPFSWSG